MERKDKDKVEGEGSYSATKDYNQRTKKFIDSGKVEQAARDAEGRAHRQGARQGRRPRPAQEVIYFLRLPQSESSRA